VNYNKSANTKTAVTGQGKNAQILTERTSALPLLAADSEQLDVTRAINNYG
jgi:hypothetical protein